MISKQKDKLVYEYNNPIIWNITGFGNVQQMEMLNSMIDIFIENNIKIPFATLHGSFICKYNGGRISRVPRDISVLKSIDKFIKKYNDLGIGIKLTFSNMSLHKEHFEEEEMRWYLDLLNEVKGIGNGIICVNDDFAELVKKNYPDLDLVASYVKMEMETKLGKTDTPDYYNSKFDLYDVVVMNPYRAFDDDFLSKITHPEKVEFIANHYCAPNCPYGMIHHKITEEAQQIHIKNNFNENLIYNDPEYQKWLKKEYCMQKKCSVRFNTLEKMRMQYLTKDEINYLSDTYGINRFKIEGRDYLISDLIMDLFQYIVNVEGPFKYLLGTHNRNINLNNLGSRDNIKTNDLNQEFSNNKFNNLLPNKIKLY